MWVWAIIFQIFENVVIEIAKFKKTVSLLLMKYWYVLNDSSKISVEYSFKYFFPQVFDKMFLIQFVSIKYNNFWLLFF